MAILYGFTARCLFDVVFLHNAKQGKLLRELACSLNSQISPATKTDCAPIRLESAKSLRQGESLISSLRWMCFLWGNLILAKVHCFLLILTLDSILQFSCFPLFHVTSSPPCWWTVNKRSLISSFLVSTSICSFHHCYLCLPRLHENHL